MSESAVDTGPEWRSFDEEKRARTYPLKLVAKTDIAVKPEHGAQWRRLARFHKEALHSREWKLAEVGAELRRVKECADLPQHVMGAAEELAKKYFSLVAEFPPEVAAVALLWTAAKRLGEPRPLKDFLRCSKAEKGQVKKAAWRLNGVVKPRRRMPIEEYVKTVAARAGLPASTAKAALEILEKNKRRLTGKNPWVWAAALWLASSRRPGLLKALAEAAGSTPFGVKDAAKKMRI